MGERDDGFRDERERQVYEQGYTHGESSHAADWDFALDGLLPEGVEPWPSQVAAYIRELQGDGLP